MRICYFCPVQIILLMAGSFSFLCAQENNSFEIHKNNFVEYVKTEMISQSALEMERLISSLDELEPTSQNCERIFQLGDFLEEYDREELTVNLYNSFYHLHQNKIPISDKTKLEFDLGCLFLQNRNYSQAEALLEKALHAEQKVYGEKSVEAAEVMFYLALLQSRRADDSEYRNKNIMPAFNELLVPSKENSGKTNPEFAIDLNVLLKQLGTPQNQEKIRKDYETILEIYEKHYGPNHLKTAIVLNNLAVEFDNNKEYEKALKFYRRVLEIEEKNWGKDSQGLLLTLYNAALACNAADKFQEAESLLVRAVHIMENNKIFNSHMASNIYCLRANNTLALWCEDLPPEQESKRPPYTRILNDRRKAFEYSLKQELYELKQSAAIELIKILNEEKKTDEIFSVMEKIRFQKLLLRLEAAGTNFLSTLPEDIAKDYRYQQSVLYAECVRLEREQTRLLKNGLDVELRQTRYFSNEKKLDEKRNELAELKEKYQTLSPVWHKLKIQSRQENAYHDIQSVLDQSKTLVLQYMIGGSLLTRFIDEQSPRNFLLVYGGGLEHPMLFALKIDEKTARQINELVPEADTVAGYLSLDLLNRLLLNKSETGLLNRIYQKDDSEKTIELSNILWKILVPSSVLRKKMTDGFSFHRIRIMPDGPLMNLSFEALVTDPNDKDHCYFLDTGPKVSYIFSSLAEQMLRKNKAQSVESVLTVGNANYDRFISNHIGSEPNDNPTSDKSEVKISDSRILARTGKFQKLYFSKNEVMGIAELASERNLSVTSLLENKATEKNFRASCSEKSIIHLACHSFTERSANNSFGALLLTPESEIEENNDGFLTVSEIMNLNLQRTKLAILSACETNLGTFTPDEGSVSVGRSFFIAGCRNVLTSNWTVDDESTSSLVYMMLDQFLEGSENEENDLAAALQKAKKSIRNFTQAPHWKKPFYWAPFVLWGAD